MNKTTKELPLRDVERELQLISIDPLVMFDRKGIILDVNDAMSRITGRSIDELIGTPFANYFTYPERAYKGAMLTFETGEVRDYELVMKDGDGTETVVSYNASAYKDQKGNVVGAFAAARDITERKRAKQELRETVRRLEEYTNRVNTLVATMPGRLQSKNESHNFRRPFSYMRSLHSPTLSHYRQINSGRWQDFKPFGKQNQHQALERAVNLTK